jgi:hypothetical protein
MRKFLAVYLVLATVVLGGLTAIGQTLDMNSISQLTRAKQMAKQEKVDYVVNTLASQPVQQAMQKAGIKLSESDAANLAGFVPPKKLDLLYSQCVFVNQSMALGQYRSTAGIVWGIIGIIALVTLIVILVVILAANGYYYDPYYY